MHAYALVNNSIDRNGIGIGNGYKPKKTKKRQQPKGKIHIQHLNHEHRLYIICQRIKVLFFFFVVSVRYAPKFHRIDGDLCS